MRVVTILKCCVLAMCASLLLSCVKSKKKEDEENGVDASGFDRGVMLTHYADHIIIPGYESFKIKLDAMKTKSVAFTSAPTLTTLSDFRNAWKEAYIEWQNVEVFDVGPASDQAFRAFMNVYPTSPANISSYMNNTSWSLETPDSYDAQGFPALDYLLNGVGATEADILEKYTTASDSAKRHAYVTRIVNHMSDKLAIVYNAWKGDYRAQFISSASMGMNGSTALMVNGYVLNFERYIRSGKFGLPSGAMLGGTPTPTLVEAYYKKDISLTLAKTSHQASVDFFNGKSRLNGTEGPSLKTYLDAVDAKDSDTGIKLTEVINNQFGISLETINLLSENFASEVTNSNQKMVDAYTELQRQVRLLKVDMTSALSITITYTDNDGD